MEWCVAVHLMHGFWTSVSFMVLCIIRPMLKPWSRRGSARGCHCHIPVLGAHKQRKGGGRHMTTSEHQSRCFSIDMWDRSAYLCMFQARGLHLHFSKAAALPRCVPGKQAHPAFCTLALAKRGEPYLPHRLQFLPYITTYVFYTGVWFL